jgi:hypothetical protein
MVDVGVGEIPAGPWGCPACQWVEPEVEEYGDEAGIAP